MKAFFWKKFTSGLRFLSYTVLAKQALGPEFDFKNSNKKAVCGSVDV